jgi:hypothetical protein
VVRIPKVSTDITISLNVPEKMNVDVGESFELFKRMVASLEIVDFALFE